MTGGGDNFTPKSWDIIYGRLSTENPLNHTRESFQYFPNAECYQRGGTCVFFNWSRDHNVLLHTGIHAKTRNGMTFDAFFAEAKESSSQRVRKLFKLRGVIFMLCDKFTFFFNDCHSLKTRTLFTTNVNSLFQFYCASIDEH